MSPAALGPQRSRLADDPAPVARWRVDFTTSDVRPRALATLPEGLTLVRASTATFATSATATDSAAANEACLSRSTDYPASQGLLVRPASGGRAADRLYVAASSVLDGGRLAFEVTLLPAAAPTGYSYSPRLWTTDAGDYAEIDHATGRLVVSIDGASWSPTAALSWTAGQTVTIRVEAGGGTEYSGASYRVGSGAPVDLGTSASVQAALAPTTIDLLCNGTSQCFEGTVRTLSAWTQTQSASAPGFSPADLSPVVWCVGDDVAGSDGDAVTNWAGRAGGPNDFIELDTADPATLKLAALGSHRAVRFGHGNFSQGLIYDVPAVFTVYWVWTALTTTTSKVWLVREDPGLASAGEVGLDGSGKLYASNGGSPLAVTISTGAAYWSGVVWNGASSRVRSLTGSGALEATGDLGTPGTTGCVFATDLTGSNGVSADVLEVLVFDRALDATERANLEAWLTDRYGL